METNSTGKSLPGSAGGQRKPRILVAPLDWGLGHATRCIPIIYELLRQECDVWIAGEDAQESLLKQEFPTLRFLALKGYRIRYGSTAMGTLWSMFTQTGKILGAIKYENDWLKTIVKDHDIDAVISDNRFGLSHPGIPCVFITHQLRIKSSIGKWPELMLQRRNYQFINRFTECWVPDFEGEDNLSGELSHPIKRPTVPLRYIGILSRLYKTDEKEQKDHLLVILSGPEPQRTILENMVVRDIAHYPGTATIARGLPGGANLIPSTNAIQFYNHLSAEQLNHEMNRAEFIISRSGYSTIMDAMRLQKKTIVIPTPGQTEQEYLAKYLRQKKIAVTIPQKAFSLPLALQEAGSFSYQLPIMKEGNLRDRIAQLLSALESINYLCR